MSLFNDIGNPFKDRINWSSEEKPWLKKLCYFLWVLVSAGMLTGILVFSSVTKNDIPSFEDLENPKYDLASIVYDTKGAAFGKYYVENREQVTFDELSPYVVNALIATEDERYYKHTGVDFRALLRVAFKTVLMRKSDSGGGSTISQQLAKLLFDRPNLRGMSKISRTWALVKVKFKEWVTAVRLEKSYTKQEIIAMYLNKFEFINGAHGIQAAAQTYFGKDQSALNIEEAAVLVGMLKNPSLYNPVRFPEKSQKRRNVVLNQLQKFNHIDQAAYDTLIIKDLNMSNFKRDAHDLGPAPYFRSELTKWLRQLFTENDIVKSDGSKYNIYTDGLKIYTTIDLNYQMKAEEAVVEHMKWNQEKYFRVWKGMNPWTYGANKRQRKIRQNSLERNIKASDRYLSLHNKYLGALKAEIKSDYGVSMNETVIKALISKEKGRISWDSLLRMRSFNDDGRALYQKILDSESWNNIKTQYDALGIAYDSIFKKEIPMTVFDYGEGFEKEVEMSPYDSVKYHNQHMQSGMLAVDPKTGHIKAWVGGVGFKYFKYDHVNSRRQVGSTIKPFVYTTAISMQGISPCQDFEDIQYSIAPGDPNLFVDKEWSPSNASGNFTGNRYNLYQGLLYSKNSITVRLLKELGNVEVIRELLKNVGINSDDKNPDGSLVVPPVPSLVLGAMDLSLMEMTGAYTTFANNGIYTQPIFVTHIEDKNGKIIYTSVPERKTAINPLYNGVMVDMLKNNVGGGYTLGVESEAGGKTGTTNDYADGWFMCITPELVVGTWVGGDDKWIRFLNLEDGQGYVMARPIAKGFLSRLEADEESGFNKNARFPKPPRGIIDFIDCNKYKQVKPEDEQQLLRQNVAKKDEFDEEFDESSDEEFDEEFDQDF